MYVKLSNISSSKSINSPDSSFCFSIFLNSLFGLIYFLFSLFGFFKSCSLIYLEIKDVISALDEVLLSNFNRFVRSSEIVIGIERPLLVPVVVVVGVFYVFEFVYM